MILMYEARVVRHFSDRKGLQIIKDIFSHEPWKPMLAEIRKQQEICKYPMETLMNNIVTTMMEQYVHPSHLPSFCRLHQGPEG